MMTDAPLSQLHRTLWTVCDDCGRDVPPRIDMTPSGPRTIIGMCQCGFLTPPEVVGGDAEPAESAVDENVEAA